MNFFKIKITPVDDENKGDIVEIEFNEEMLNNFIKERKLILNDIIYPDKVKYAYTKKNYNTAWDKVIGLIKSMGKLKMKECELILMEGTKELKELMKLRDQEFNSQMKLREQEIQLLMEEIQALKNNQK